MGNLSSPEKMNSFSQFKSSFITEISYNQHDFPVEDGYLLYQKNNKNERIFIRNIFFQSRTVNIS